MFKLCNQQYKLDSKALTRSRLDNTDMSIKRMAALCGWSYTYQWQLENGFVETVSEETKRVIEEVLKDN